MSWDSYIDNLIAQSKDASGASHADKVCIIGLDGGAKWTSDDHEKAFKLTAEESANIAKCFKSKDFTSFMTSGLRCEDQKYQFLRQEDGKLVLAKKKEVGSVTLQASKTAIVIAFTGDSHQQGNTNKAVAVIADYLESTNM
ncbi:profilin-like [Anneissia japonica]|uniref:profilin-like n=1 Tax=Anneissia japonica TaxID=1529436 RepID=UPI0014254CC9|nr:profilin-like [Anneissia japonica]